MECLCKNSVITIRRMEDNLEDYSIMTKWLTDPQVLKYYGGRDKKYDLDSIKEKYTPRVLGKEPVTSCIIDYKGDSVGYVQFYILENSEYDERNELQLGQYKAPYGIDLFIGNTDYQNQGIGTMLLQLLIQYLIQIKKADAVFIDPQTWNKRAIRCYEKSGFKPVRILEKREFHEGEYKDNLIMSIEIDKDSTR